MSHLGGSNLYLDNLCFKHTCTLEGKHVFFTHKLSFSQSLKSVTYYCKGMYFFILSKPSEAPFLFILSIKMLMFLFWHLNRINESTFLFKSEKRQMRGI